MNDLAAISAEEREALGDSLRRLLADRCTEKDVRRVMETREGYDFDLWTRLVELGLPGLAIDAEHGGSGTGPREIEAVMEVAGAALLPSPLLASLMAAELLAALGDAAASARLLPRIAEGEIVAVVLGEAPTLRAASHNGGWTLTGTAPFVLHGQNAKTLLALAETPDGPRVVEVPLWGHGVQNEPLPTFDHTSRLARIRLNGAAAIPLSGDAAAAMRRATDLGIIALAGGQAGAARRVLDVTVDYAKQRIQFGRAIGSFQAIKHMAADLLLEVESATSVARNAAAKLADGAPDAEAAIALAAFACAEAFVTTAATAIQMHGGIAFTWDHPAHLYLRRARFDALLFGDAAAHRERYLTALGA